VIVTVAAAVDPSLLSVTVTVYDPAIRPVSVAPVPPEEAQLYVKGPTPPLTETVAEPSLPPKQLTFVCLLMLTICPAANAPKLTIVKNKIAANFFMGFLF
jgi:hypothetical protein